MKNLLKLERVIDNSSKVYNRRDAIKAYRKLMTVRHQVGAFIRVAKQNNLEVNISQIRESAAHFRYTFKRQVSQKTTSYRLFRPVGRADMVEVYMSTSGENRYKEAMDEIRHRVKRIREERQYNDDRLVRKRPNSVLIRHQERILGTSKLPKDNARYVGIEIECIMPRNSDLSSLLPFGKWINVGTDASIQHGSNEDGKEIRVCVRKSEINKVIPPLMDALKALNAYVNKSCGLHVHLDQRNNPQPELSFTKLYRSLGLLYTVVPKSRRVNTYCKRNHRVNFQEASVGDRYKAINATAYRRYKTLEVRLFGGTLEAEKIINWIEVLHGITDGNMVTRCPKTFDLAKKHWRLTDANVTWLKSRQAKFAELNQLAPLAESDDVEPIELDDSDSSDDIRAEINNNQLQEVA